MAKDILDTGGLNNPISGSSELVIFLQRIIRTIQKDFGGEHSDDEHGGYDPSPRSGNKKLPIDDAIKHISIHPDPDPNRTDCPPQHYKELRGGERVSVNPTGVVINLLSDGADLRGEDRELIDGLYLDVALTNEGKVRISGTLNYGSFLEKNHPKAIDFELFFTLSGGTVEEKQ